MIWYYSSIGTWSQHFVRKAGLNPRAPLPNGVVCFPHAFPSFGDFYSEKGRVRKLPYMGSKSVILDSGAHHFFNLSGHSVTSERAGGSVDEIDLHRYVQQYIAFIQHNWSLIDYFVELDLGDIYGMKTVRAIRREFQAAEIFDKCIGGWHYVNGDDDYDEMLEWPSRFVALEGMRRNARQLPYMKLIEKAYKAGVKVHGFAMTKPEALKRWPFYSVDSTSWLGPDRHGQIRMFDEQAGEFRTVYCGKVSKFKTSKERLHPVVTMDLYDQLVYALNESVKAKEWFTRYWRGKGITWKEQIEKHGGIYDDDRKPTVLNNRIRDTDFHFEEGRLELQT